MPARPARTPRGSAGPPLATAAACVLLTAVSDLHLTPGALAPTRARYVDPDSPDRRIAAVPRASWFTDAVPVDSVTVACYVGGRSGDGEAGGARHPRDPRAPLRQLLVGRVRRHRSGRGVDPRGAAGIARVARYALFVDALAQLMAADPAPSVTVGQRS